MVANLTTIQLAHIKQSPKVVINQIYLQFHFVESNFLLKVSISEKAVRLYALQNTMLSASLVALVMCLELWLAQAGLKEDIAACPLLPDLSTYFEALPSLGRRLQIATPCMGIDGAGHALKVLGCPTDVHNCYDLQDSYRQVLTHHLKSMGMESITLNLGPVDGNLLNVPLRTLRKPIDFLISGPPCPPWAGQGKHLGRKDDRAQVFIRVLTWVVYLIFTGGLIGCILENVPGILHVTPDGREPVATSFLDVLRKFCPMFDWQVCKLELQDYLFPQSRVRVFLRGLRKVFAECVPPPLAPWGRRHLRDALGKSPHTPRDTWSVPQQRNIADCEENIKSLQSKGKLNLDDVVVVPADRSHSEEIIYNSSMSINCVPTLTTHNTYLCVMSVRDVVHEVADSEREYFRKLTGPERLGLQAFPPDIAELVPEDKHVFASGNAFPPALIIAVLQPMLKAVGPALAEWPPAEVLKDEDLPFIDDFIKALCKPGKIINRGKYLVHKAAQKKKSRKRRARSCSS